MSAPALFVPARSVSSRGCVPMSHKVITLTCDYCGNQFERLEWRVRDKSAKRTYCSRGCYTKAQQRTPDERFAEKYIVSDTLSFNGSPCWIWTANTTQWGYGTFWIQHGVGIHAHRWSYEHSVGPIPDGFEIDHLCRRRKCVNPEHLEPVTRRENVIRGISPASVNAAKTHCIHGHEFTTENTYYRKDRGNGTHRMCRACHNERMRARKQAKRGDRNARD